MKWKQFWICCLLPMLVACDKYLDVRPDKAVQIPSTLADVQALLANTQVMNTGIPGIGEVAADNIYVLTDNWKALSDPTSRNAYIWKEDLFNESDRNDWTLPYQTVLHANMALEILDGLPEGEKVKANWAQLKGAALFFRAFSFYGMAQVFCLPYNPATATTDLGLPLRLTASVEEPLSRSSVAQTYAQILADGEAAARLLPPTAQYKTEPTKPAAYALLARTALAIGDTEGAGRYADTCLRLYGSLLDYNTVNAAATNPMPRFNTEVLFHAQLFGRTILSANVANIDTVLYRSYETNDLRRTLFFRANNNGGVSFRGSYIGSSSYFGGLATDEVYLIRAESRARQGDTQGAMEDLNYLLQHRYRKGTFVPRTAATPEEALAQVLLERRKQLLYRGIRWSDLRRFNREGLQHTTLIRYLDGQEYRLPPGDPRYALPLPNKVIRLSGMSQNPR